MTKKIFPRITLMFLLIIKTITFKIREVLKPNNYYDKYIVNILKINEFNVTGKSIINIQKDSISIPLKVDDIFITKALLENINPHLNPNQFNYKAFLEKKWSPN